MLGNATEPDSQLKKNSNSVAYCHDCEGVARDEWNTTYINTHENPTDLLTKTLPLDPKRDDFYSMLLHHTTGIMEVPSDHSADEATMSLVKE